MLKCKDTFEKKHSRHFYKMVIKVTESKTMFSRMADIQKTGLDEEGMTINQVERALKRINVTLRDSDDTWRNFEDVLKDVSSKWSDLDDVTRADIGFYRCPIMW